MVCFESFQLLLVFLHLVLDPLLEGLVNDGQDVLLFGEDLVACLGLRERGHLLAQQVSNVQEMIY